MTILKANVNFKNSFNGELIVPNGTVKIGITEKTLLPYDLLFGALASCLYSTFLDVVVKKKINFDLLFIYYFCVLIISSKFTLKISTRFGSN